MSDTTSLPDPVRKTSAAAIVIAALCIIVVAGLIFHGIKVRDLNAQLVVFS